jgi:hypothetical protein
MDAFKTANRFHRRPILLRNMGQASDIRRSAVPHGEDSRIGRYDTSIALMRLDLARHDDQFRFSLSWFCLRCDVTQLKVNDGLVTALITG